MNEAYGHQVVSHVRAGRFEAAADVLAEEYRISSEPQVGVAIDVARRCEQLEHRTLRSTVQQLNEQIRHETDRLLAELGLTPKQPLVFSVGGDGSHRRCSTGEALR